MKCGFCGGTVVRDHDRIAYVHASDGDRVRASGPGDYASASHNRAGTVVTPADLVDDEQE